MNTFSKRKKKTENGTFLDFIKNTPLSFYFIGIFSRTKLDKQRVLDFFLINQADFINDLVQTKHFHGLQLGLLFDKKN